MHQSDLLVIMKYLKRRKRLMKKLNNSLSRNIYNKRLGIVESVFGTITEHRKFRQFLVRGKEKVKMQWSMVCSAFNLRRLFSLMNC